MTENIPRATHSATFRLFGVDVRVHVLDNGQRIIEAKSLSELLEAMSDSRASNDDVDMEAFARWARGLS